jgi:uncharacterized protein YciI
MYWALLYDLVDDYLERRAPLREAHLGLARAASERGELLLAGAFDDPPDLALLVFRAADASVARRFVDQDPYVEHGLVRSWRIRPWNVVIGADPAGPP